MEYKRLTERVGKGIAVKETSKNDNMSIWNAIEHLAELEDKIEQGTLIELPCKVGDTVYYVCDYGSVVGECVSLEIGKVSAFAIQRNHIWIEVNYEDGLRMHHRADEIGKTVFLTCEEAEKRLKELL